MNKPPYQRTAEEALREARQNLSLESLIFQLTGVKIDKRSPCPRCGKNGKFRTWIHDSVPFCRCYSTKCDANEVRDDIGFIMLVEGIDRKAAFKKFLNLANVA